MAKKNLTPDFIFESSWEICNKVGGIYTVLSTRAKTLKEEYEDRVIFVGPDIWDGTENPDFKESKTLLKGWKSKVKEQYNLNVRVGRWNVPGEPLTVLVDFRPLYEKKDEIYARMWEKFGVDSLSAYGDYDESCMFAVATGQVIESLYGFLKLEGKNVVAHLNEWMLGMAVLYLRDKAPGIATVFTTHATSIGRSICGNRKPLYDILDRYDGDQMARELNMVSKHSVEKQAAHYANCFTTVSKITAAECKQLLDKEPDVITPNGFEFNFVPEGAEFEKKRKAARKALIKTASRLCAETISEDSLLVAISGRYEYENKGIDVFVESINRIRLENPERQIVAFILVPAWINGPREDLAKAMKSTKKTAGSPLHNPFVTHRLNCFERDKVCNYLRYLNFLNQPEHKTKIVFVPSYLNGADGILDLPYYEILTGIDLTVFPSYYEPWGYTPLESIAFGAPTITTNLAGFGRWLLGNGISGGNIEEGVAVIKRNDGNYFEVAEAIKNEVVNYSKLAKPEVKKARSAAKKLSKKASWANFIKYYHEAYNIALKNNSTENKNRKI
ncbi:MAG: glycogen/starch synthase [Dysgonamonadaceae bacterium]|jgi:glycosyltransferase involved in cell wall biosynthesis|nr:glycogen/starch synthase [Dysgonamonadaceae bacterium]